MTALYVGSALDFSLRHFPAGCVVVADPRPFVDLCACEFSHRAAYSEFVQTLDRRASNVNLPLTKVENKVRTYGQRLRYVTNLSLPRERARITTLGPFSSLLMKEYVPHECVLESFEERGNTLIGFSNVDYDGGYDCDTLWHSLMTHETTRRRFARFILVTKGGERVHCDSWNDFVRLQREERVRGFYGDRRDV